MMVFSISSPNVLFIYISSARTRLFPAYRLSHTADNAIIGYYNYRCLIYIADQVRFCQWETKPRSQFLASYADGGWGSGHLGR
jgi:hypothetical protein